MRAVTGSVVSSEPISLRRAAGIVSNFARAEVGARPEAAAYVRRASKAFDELAQFHREIRGRETESHIQDEERGENHGQKKKRKEMEDVGFEDGVGGIPVPRAAGRNPNRGPEGGFQVRQEEEGRNPVTSVVDLEENGGVLRAEEDWDRERKKKKKKKAEEGEEGKGNPERNSKERRKSHREAEAEAVRRLSDKDERDGHQKKRRHSHVEKEERRPDDSSVRHKQKKKRRMEV